MASQAKTHEGDSTPDITQLFFLDSSQARRKASRICTHAVDYAIQLLDNNRVLKERPPPISDNGQKLNQRQQCTVLQLRSGHCHLLQDYNHRVFGEPSDICTDCGASKKTLDTCSLATHTRLTCHQRIYGGINLCV